jgi:hypothetical protein
VLITAALAVAFLFVLGYTFPERSGIQVAAFLLTTFTLVLTTAALVLQIAHSQQADRSTLFCAINSYLLIGVTGAVLMIIAELLVTGSFTGMESSQVDLEDFMYFAFVTLTTLGYGDISPVSGVGRSLSIFISLTGQLYLVIIMALIIGKYLNAQGPPKDKD